MQRNENTFKKYLIKLVGTRWDVQSHEDKFSAGIPDLSYGCAGVNGWIELKYIAKWKKSGIMRFTKFTKIQHNWLKKRGKKGGNCWVFIKIENSYYLYSWADIHLIIDGFTSADIEKWARCEFHSSVNVEFLLEALSEGKYAYTKTL